MSKVSLEALFEAIDKGFGICEIEPIMYVDLLKTGRNKRESMSYVERVTNALHELGIYHISDLIKTSKERLFMGRLGLNSLAFLGNALMKMDQLGDCESIFKKDIYKDLIYTVAGHMGDANFHIIPLVDIHKEGVKDVLHQLMDEVFALVFEYKGSMSGEHNDGLLRTQYLPKMFSPEIISLFEKTKAIFDPDAILNPGKKVHGDKDFAWSHVDTK